MMNKTFQYDVFVSHSSRDKKAARELARRLRADGLRVWFDEWAIVPGDTIGLKIEQGLAQSRTLILIMSANAFASEWVTLERHTALFRDPTNTQRRFIPLRLDDAEIPDALKQFAYVDWRQRSDEQYAGLLAVCRPSVVPVEPGEGQPGAQILADGVWRCRGSTAGAAYVGSKKSDRFHRPSCPWTRLIGDENRICFANRSTATAFGHSPCRTCKP